MTIKEMKKINEKRIARYEMQGLSSLTEYATYMFNKFIELYENGTVTEFNNEFLAMANGFQINSNNYETFHIGQTLNLHRISVDNKTTARKFLEFWINN